MSDLSKEDFATKLAMTVTEALYENPEIFGASVLEAEVDEAEIISEGVITYEESVFVNQVITETVGNSQEAISALTEADIEDFLCENYWIGLHQKVIA